MDYRERADAAEAAVPPANLPPIRDPVGVTDERP